MLFSVSTWNINSIRLRLDQVQRFLEKEQPDILCLQETKCPDEHFPVSECITSGYPFVSCVGQKGYNGVAILSKYSFTSTLTHSFCERNDARHIAITLGKDARNAAGLAIHNFYVPAGGDVPDPEQNPKFAHKLQFLQEMYHFFHKTVLTEKPSILVGDLNIAPLENDVWSHKQLLKVVSHTPVETETLETIRQEAGWVDAIRSLHPEPEKIYTWWSYRSSDWEKANKGRRLDHIWVSPDMKPNLKSLVLTKETRSWERPSDHVPVTLKLDL